MSSCLYPGSFDPVTNGHLDLIRRAARMFDRVYVGVLFNPDKKGLFTPTERVTMLEEVCTDIPNVRIVTWDGLTAELAGKMGVSCLIRGVRSCSDLDAEMPMARLNRMLCPGLDTVFLPASPQWEDISSSAVRQIAFFGGDISEMVPASVREAVCGKYDR